MPVIKTPINNLGYGIFGYGIIRCLIAYYQSINSAEKVVIRKLGPEHSGAEQEYKDIYGATVNIPYQDVIKAAQDLLPNEVFGRLITLWHPGHLLSEIPAEVNKKRAIVHFETDNFLDQEIENLMAMDMIGVSSNWARSIIQSRLPINPNKVKVIHGPCTALLNENIASPKEDEDISKLYTGVKLFFERNPGPIFMSAGKWEVRKSHSEILESMVHVGSTNLIGLWDNPFDKGLSIAVQEAIRFKYKVSALGPYKGKPIYLMLGINQTRLILLPRLDTWQEVRALMSKIDIYIGLSKGEGWDLPTVDAMYLKKPVILSKNTAHLEYLYTNVINPNFDRLVQQIEIECSTQAAYDGKWFFGRSDWYHPSFEQTTEAIKKLKTTDKINLNTIGNIGHNIIKKLCDPIEVGKRVDSLLQ